MPLLAAGKVFPIFSNWAHCLALQSPDCGSLFLHPPPIGGTLLLNSDYVNVNIFHTALCLMDYIKLN